MSTTFTLRKQVTDEAFGTVSVITIGLDADCTMFRGGAWRVTRTARVHAKKGAEGLQSAAAVVVRRSYLKSHRLTGQGQTRTYE